MGIGETLHRALAKLVMRADGDQAKTACGNLQMCPGLEASIEGFTHAAETGDGEGETRRRGGGGRLIRRREGGVGEWEDGGADK